VTGRVHTPILLSTPYLHFVGLSSSNVRKTVTIRAQKEDPLRIEVLSFDLTDKLIYRIEEAVPGREFRVHLATIPGVSGTYIGAMKLKTNYPKKAILTIRIRGSMKQDLSQ